MIFWKNRPCFVVKNFLSGGTPSNLIHLENFWPKASDGRMTEYFLPELMSIVKNRAGYRAEVQIVQLIIFDYLIGNFDRHRGNIAFIQDKKGIQLAPIYDNVSELGLEQEDFLSADDKFHPAMRILVEGATKVNALIYLKALVHLDYAREVYDFCSKLKKEMPSVLNAIDNAFYLTTNFKAAFKDLVHRRFQEIIKAMEELK